MAVRNFTLDNFKFPNTSDITKKSEYYGFGTDIDGPLSYNEFTDNITMPITSQKAELIEESITIERIEYDLKLLVSNGVVINLPTQNVKIGRKVTIIPKFILNGEEVEDGKATVSAGQYSWKIYWDSFITFCWNGSFWYIDNHLSSYFFYPSPTKFLEKVLFGRIGKNWTQSSVTNTSFSSIAYGGDSSNGMWVAGSDGNAGLYYSTDGKEWTQSNIASGSFTSVAYGDDMWVAGSSNNKGLYYSTDGQNWTPSNIASGSFKSVAYGGDLWVAGSYGTGLYYSTDGQNWTQSDITSGKFRLAVYANGKWVAGSYDNHGLYYSEDGKNWTPSNIASGKFYSVAYANDLWVAGSDHGLYYSTDGQNWTQSNITKGSFYSVAYGDGKWVACSNNNKGLYYSTDGKEWTQSNIQSGAFNSVAYANGMWVAGGSIEAGLCYSEDGKFFNNAFRNKEIRNIAYGNLKIVCTSNDGILVSEID